MGRKIEDTTNLEKSNQTYDVDQSIPSVYW